MLLVQVQLAQLSPHGVMVAALDLGSSGRKVVKVRVFLWGLC